MHFFEILKAKKKKRFFLKIKTRILNHLVCTAICQPFIKHNPAKYAPRSTSALVRIHRHISHDKIISSHNLARHGVLERIVVLRMLLSFLLQFCMYYLNMDFAQILWNKLSSLLANFLIALINANVYSIGFRNRQINKRRIQITFRKIPTTLAFALRHCKIVKTYDIFVIV